MITPATSAAVQNLLQIRLWEASGQIGEIQQKLCIYLYLFGNSPTRQTGRWIFTRDYSNDAHSRKHVPLGGFVDIALYLRGQVQLSKIRNFEV